QVSMLLEKPDDSFIERIQFKASFSFLSKLNQYIIYLENNFFQPEGIRVAGTVVPAPFILERFKAAGRTPLLKRIPVIVKDIQAHVRTNVNRKLTGRDKAMIWQAVLKMIRTDNVLELYKEFYGWLKKSELFRMQGETLEYA